MPGESRVPQGSPVWGGPVRPLVDQQLLEGHRDAAWYGVDLRV